jgi:hypothetical protein
VPHPCGAFWRKGGIQPRATVFSLQSSTTRFRKGREKIPHERARGIPPSRTEHPRMGHPFSSWLPDQKRRDGPRLREITKCVADSGLMINEISPLHSLAGNPHRRSCQTVQCPGLTRTATPRRSLPRSLTFHGLLWLVGPSCRRIATALKRARSLNLGCPILARFLPQGWDPAQSQDFLLQSFTTRFRKRREKFPHRRARGIPPSRTERARMGHPFSCWLTKSLNFFGAELCPLHPGLTPRGCILPPLSRLKLALLFHAKQKIDFSRTR